MPDLEHSLSRERKLEGWPQRLWFVRHGESCAEVASKEAQEQGAETVEPSSRDVDAPLTSRGETEVTALGLSFAQRPEEERPNVLLTSPYARTRQTALLFKRAGGCAERHILVMDERLREREPGILDELTTAGVETQHPEQARLRKKLGKFYHRPPGGESWCDVVLRLRTMSDGIGLRFADRRVMLFTHQAVILCSRYIIEELDEAEVCEIDVQGEVKNCSVTDYRFEPSAGLDGGMVLGAYNVTSPNALLIH